MALRDKLIRKYLKKFLTKLTKPMAPAFTSETRDVLLNPDFYSSKVKNNKKIPNFDTFNTNSAQKAKKVIQPKLVI